MQKRGLLRKGLNRGLTLIETLFVLAVAAIILAAIAILGPILLSYQKVNSESGFLGFISSKVAQTFASFPAYQGLNNKLMINSGNIPKDRIIDPAGGEIGHPFDDDGRVYFGYNQANPRQWVLIYQALPKKACIELAKRFRPENLSAVYITTTPITPNANGAVTLPGAGRISATDANFVSQVNTLCSAADAVNVAWVLR